MTKVALDGQVAIVTGSGAGLGRAYALELASRGAQVVVNDVSTERADDTVATIADAGGRAVASYDSVASQPGGRAIVESAIQAFGDVSIVVCNAGTMRNAYFEDQSPDDLDAMIAVHIGGCFWVTQAAWPIMKRKRYGRVVLVGSSGGMWSMHAITNYAAAKGGVYGLGRALAFEGREHGINVNVLLPGAATTITAASPVPDYDKYFPHPDLGKALAARRTAESVAPLAAYLTSEACTVTGETFSAVAGRYARVLVGVTDGWFADDIDSVTAEDIAQHFDEICNTTNYVLPSNLFDEYRAMAPRLGVELPAVGLAIPPH